MGYELIFLDAAKKTELEPLCEQVLKRFELPQQELIAIFDDEERQELTLFTPSLGKEFCGFFRANLYGMRPFPQKIKDDYLWKDGKWRCDVFIYLRSRTCQSPTGAAITFAHELQHFMQYGFSRKVWQANHDLQQIIEGFPWYFPDERDALTVSRSKIEEICGKDRVRGYAEQQIGLKRHPEKWGFFLGSETEKPFDFLQATILLVNEYKEALKNKFPVSERRPDPDYTKERWWE
jgi:hypothetical protein